MKPTFLFFLTCLAAVAIYVAVTSADSRNVKLEKAYFEGQKDALRGDIRIRMNKDSVYEWTKSPWNDGSKYTFIPTKADSK